MREMQGRPARGSRRSLATGAVIAGLAMVMAACGQGAGQTTTGAAKPAAQPTTAETRPRDSVARCACVIADHEFRR